MLNVQGVGRTETGLTRKDNEDVFAIDIDLGLFAVYDGMGGAQAGEVAAGMTAETIGRSLRERSDELVRVRHDPTRANDLATVVSDAIGRACEDVHARSLSDPGLAGMGSTATVLVVAGNKAAMGHVGDSRLYLVRSGQAHQLSTDHTLAAELARQGVIEPRQIRTHPHAHVLTRVVGPQPSVDIETLIIDLAPGDRLLVCSDGLSNYLPTLDFLAQHLTGSPLEDAVDDLVDYALSSGGRDNVTVIAVDVGGEAPDPTRPFPTAERLIGILGSSFLFSNLSLAQLARVLERSELAVFRADEIVKDTGDVLDELLVVITGKLRVQGPDGSETIVGPGQHLGEEFVLRPRPTLASVVATEETHLLRLSGTNLSDLLNRRPWLGVALLSRFVERLSYDLDGRTPVDGSIERTAVDRVL